MELVVNWHITEACNFSCSYCFAKWEDKYGKELLHSADKVKKLMDEIQKLKGIFNQNNPKPFTHIRLNLVGGETFLYKKQVLSIIKEGKIREFDLSAITNGSCLDDEVIDAIASSFSNIGFSIDSLNDSTNLSIGRAVKNKPMDVESIFRSIKRIRNQNLNIDIKINTVVSALNLSENFHEFIGEIKPTKWKIFKMLPILTDEQSITDQDFTSFLERHNDLYNVINSENNDEMTDSYLMIDPMGRFFQNSNSHGGYSYSKEIIEHGAEKALNDIEFNISKFRGRYKLIKTANIAAA